MARNAVSRGCAWTSEEDAMLLNLVQRHGPRNWPFLSESIPGRSGKSCRLRWLNHLSPEVSHDPFTPEEDRIIIDSHARMGNKWAAIARMLIGRTDNRVKNYWNYTLKKKLAAEQQQQQQDAGPSTELTLALTYYHNDV